MGHRTWHGSTTYVEEPGKYRSGPRCKHRHLSYETARACGDKMAARRNATLARKTGGKA